MATQADHPGQLIRATVIPPGMAVTAAAKLLGVSRPALSNLLNGKAALTAEMAARLEKAFDTPRAQLMEWQARFDAAEAAASVAPAASRPYVHPFLQFKAADISGWAAGNIVARARFAVFLRTLVHSTGALLRSVDFPGNDDSQRPGWDGLVDAGEATPWIPEGVSGWEFGTNEAPKAKADKDFAKSLQAISDPSERASITFVFVTPQRWTGAKAWADEKRALKQWRDVRVYDASTLEQWLERSLSGQVWFANEAHHPSQGVRSLEAAWREWADATTPPLDRALFKTAITAARRQFFPGLAQRGKRPLVVSADSTDEALAFLACMFADEDDPQAVSMRDRVIVFDQPGVLPKLAMGATDFVAVVHTHEVERELAPLTSKVASIVIAPRNSASTHADVVLERVQSEAFRDALFAMGKNREQAARLERATGRSLTVLRRQLANTPLLREPAWARDNSIASELIPMMFAGAWNEDAEADKEAIEAISAQPYDVTERAVHRLATLSDAPVWASGTVRGVVSKIDVMFALRAHVTKQDIERFLKLAAKVLGEDDPALDLPEEDRWSASWHGKTRQYSALFRRSVAETLVLLAVHGRDLYFNSLGVNPEREVARIVGTILPQPLTIRTLEANDRDLPTYAEAAPERFLEIIEADLRSQAPATVDLMRPVDASIFGAHPARTGLLWALEGLAWNPASFSRAVNILSRLAEVEIQDNWMNKPINSLESIFRSWMPQTAASLEQRIDAIKAMKERHPAVAWKICIAQFSTLNGTGSFSHKPGWRSDGYGYGEPLSDQGLVNAFVMAMVEVALAWSNHTLTMLGDLVDRVSLLSAEHQAKVWSLVEVWSSTASEKDKAALRETVRRAFYSRRATAKARRQGRSSQDWAADRAYKALEPSDPVDRHAWLFRNAWIDDGLMSEDVEIDLKTRDQLIEQRRVTALREIQNAVGRPGLLELILLSQNAEIIGSLCVRYLHEDEDVNSLILDAFRRVLDGYEQAAPLRQFVAGAIRTMSDSERDTFLDKAGELLSSADDSGSLLLLAPYGPAIWRRVDALPETSQRSYWRDVVPDAWMLDGAPLTESIERLLRARRPRAAFNSFRHRFEHTEPALVARVLSTVAAGGDEISGQYMLDRYQLEEAFKFLAASPQVPFEDMVRLELAFIDAIAPSLGNEKGYGIPNLERYVDQHPEMFVHALVWVYRRKDGALDPDSFRVPPEGAESAWHRGHKLLDGLRELPGRDNLGVVSRDRLLEWVTTVREAARSLSRLEVADICIGRLLSHAKEGADGVWPPDMARDVLEEFASDDMITGAHTGVFNARGAHWRGEGGAQERALADRYRRWADALRISHPFVASRLLDGLVATYESDACREDTQAVIRQRLGH